LSLKQKVIKGIKWTSISAVVVTVIQLLQLAIVARFLEPSDFGLMAIVMIVIGFSQAFSDMGISNAIIHKQEITHEQLSTLYWVNILSGVILFTIIALLAPLVATFYQEPELTKLTFIVATTFLIQPLGQQFMVLCQKEMKFSEIAKIDITNKSISLVVSIYLAYEGRGVYALVFGTIAGVTVQSALFFYIGMKKYKPSFRFKFGEIKSFITFGLYQMGEKSINYISANIDKILIGKLIGVEALGFYNFAWQLIIFPLAKINPIVNKVAFPMYAKVQSDTKKLSQYYTKSLSALFLITVPLLIFMFYYSSEIVYVAYGKGWELTATLLSILVIVGLSKTVGNPAGALLLAIGRPDVGFWWNAFWALLVSFVLYTTMIISPEITSVAYSLLSLSLITSYFYHRIIQKTSKVKYKELIFNFLKVFGVSILFGYISTTCVNIIHIENSLIRLLIGSMICLLLYLLYLKKNKVPLQFLFEKRVK